MFVLYGMLIAKIVGVSAIVSIPTILLAWKVNSISGWLWSKNQERQFEGDNARTISGIAKFGGYTSSDSRNTPESTYEDAAVQRGRKGDFRKRIWFGDEESRLQ